MKLKKLYILLLGVSSCLIGHSQNVALKTNLLSDVFADVNFGIEVGMAPRWTFELTGDFNGWNVNDHRWRHFLVQPEFRYWFCSKFSGNFIGIHAIGGNYNFGNISNNVKFLGSDFSGLTDHRYQGWGVGGGISYGHSWILGQHWNLEATIGVGYIFTRFDTYECVECGRLEAKDQTHNYFGPTKAGISIEYIF